MAGGWNWLSIAFGGRLQNYHDIFVLLVQNMNSVVMYSYQYDVWCLKHFHISFKYYCYCARRKYCFSSSVLCVDMKVPYDFEGICIHASFYFTVMVLTKTTNIHY
jgi:hypothetical protein